MAGRHARRPAWPPAMQTLPLYMFHAFMPQKSFRILTIFSCRVLQMKGMDSVVITVILWGSGLYKSDKEHNVIPKRFSHLP